MTPYAAVDLEHNSNIFDLQTNQTNIPGYPTGSLADTFLESRAGAERFATGKGRGGRFDDL